MEILSTIGSWLWLIIDFIIHVDAHLDELVARYDVWLYAILFLIVFCETGLVVTPFLPGDSLLFATGAIIARDDSPLNLGIMAVLLIVAGVLGDAVNYAIGRRVGPRIFVSEKSFLLNRKHLEYTQAFYAKHGGKTIILARFMPIVRTFAPFVAGIGHMQYRQFAAYNVIGAVTWVISFLLLGYFFGAMPFVKKNFSLVILGIIFLSILPGIIEFWRVKRQARVKSH